MYDGLGFVYYLKETFTFVNLLNHAYGDCLRPFQTLFRRNTLSLLLRVSNPKGISMYTSSKAP